MGERGDAFDEEKAVHNLVLAAALRRDAKALKDLRDSGVKIDAQNGIGETALHHVCQIGYVAEAEALLEAGADKNAVSRIGQTPLGLAIINGHGPLAELLLRRGADPDQLIDFGIAPLTSAVESGDAALVRLLLENDASVTPRPPSTDHPAIIVAAREGHLPILRMLVEEFGVDVNTSIASGETPLTSAIFAQKHNCFEYLLDHGADIHFVSTQGLTPIYTAAATDNDHAIEVLLKRGISVDGIANRLDCTPLMSAVCTDALKAAKVLLDHGAKIDPVAGTGRTARQEAELNESAAMVQLIDAEARRRHLIAVEKDAAHAHGGVSGDMKVRKPLVFRKL